MKDINIDAVGGRVRACRKTLNLTLAQISKAINVSANYISMIERGEKNPSDKVLHKIADLAGVSYWWLKTGQEESPVKPQEPSSPSNAIPVSIDVPLFLALAIQSIPDMTKEKLAAKLDVSPEAMEEILLGGGYAVSPDWMDYFQILARQMDLPAVRQKIHDLDLFLQNEIPEKERKRRVDFLKRYAGPEYQYRESDPNDSDHIMLKTSREDGTPQNTAWHFFFFLGYSLDESMVKCKMDSIICWCCNFCNNMTLVFDDESLRTLFVEEYEDRQAKEDALAELSSGYSGQLPFMTLLLINRDTWEEIGEPIELDDGESPEDMLAQQEAVSAALAQMRHDGSK